MSFSHSPRLEGLCATASRESDTLRRLLAAARGTSSSTPGRTDQDARFTYESSRAPRAARRDALAPAPATAATPAVGVAEWATGSLQWPELP